MCGPKNVYILILMKGINPWSGYMCMCIDTWQALVYIYIYIHCISTYIYIYNTYIHTTFIHIYIYNTHPRGDPVHLKYFKCHPPTPNFFPRISNISASWSLWTDSHWGSPKTNVDKHLLGILSLTTQRSDFIISIHQKCGFKHQQEQNLNHFARFRQKKHGWMSQDGPIWINIPI